MKRSFCIALLLAGLANSGVAQEEYTEQQLAALAVLTPMAQAQIPGEPGEFLAECILLSAKRRELRKLAKADPENPGDAVITMANKIVARPEVTTCLTERLTAK